MRVSMVPTFPAPFRSERAESEDIHLKLFNRLPFVAFWSTPTINALLIKDVPFKIAFWSARQCLNGTLHSTLHYVVVTYSALIIPATTRAKNRDRLTGSRGHNSTLNTVSRFSLVICFVSILRGTMVENMWRNRDTVFYRTTKLLPSQSRRQQIIE